MYGELIISWSKVLSEITGSRMVMSQKVVHAGDNEMRTVQFLLCLPLVWLIVCFSRWMQYIPVKCW
jgi:hypothetical protein